MKYDDLGVEIPVVLILDLEPDENDVDRQARRPWHGFEVTLAWAEALRDRVAEVTGVPGRFTWVLRMDPQVEDAYGSLRYVPDTYGRELDRLTAAGDVLGLHPHAWRWRDPPGEWIADHGDHAWVEHCMDISFAAFEETFGAPCRVHRFGDRFMHPVVLRHMRRLGVAVDLTVEPGARPMHSTHAGMGATGMLPDYAPAPRRPYRATADDPQRADDSPDAPGPWFLPLTSADPGPTRPAWWRAARRIRYPLRPSHRPAPLDLPRPVAPFITRIESAVAAMPRPYLAFGIRTDAPVMRSEDWTLINDKVDALLAGPLGPRLRFVDPETAVTRLT
jgi:hypothetical protein